MPPRSKKPPARDPNVTRITRSDAKANPAVKAAVNANVLASRGLGEAPTTEEMSAIEASVVEDRNNRPPPEPKPKKVTKTGEKKKKDTTKKDDKKAKVTKKKKETKEEKTARRAKEKAAAAKAKEAKEAEEAAKEAEEAARAIEEVEAAEALEAVEAAKAAEAAAALEAVEDLTEVIGEEFTDEESGEDADNINEEYTDAVDEIEQETQRDDGNIPKVIRCPGPDHWTGLRDEGEAETEPETEGDDGYTPGTTSSSSASSYSDDGGEAETEPDPEEDEHYKSLLICCYGSDYDNGPKADPASDAESISESGDHLVCLPDEGRPVGHIPSGLEKKRKAEEAAEQKPVKKAKKATTKKRKAEDVPEKTPAKKVKKEPAKKKRKAGEPAEKKPAKKPKKKTTTKRKAEDTPDQTGAKKHKGDKSPEVDPFTGPTIGCYWPPENDRKDGTNPLPEVDPFKRKRFAGTIIGGSPETFPPKEDIPDERIICRLPDRCENNPWGPQAKKPVEGPSDDVKTSLKTKHKSSETDEQRPAKKNKAEEEPEVEKKGKSKKGGWLGEVFRSF